MFVKVDGAFNPSLFEVPASPNSLEYGSRVTTRPPWEVDWSLELNVKFRFVSYRGGRIAPHHVPANMPDDVSTDDFWVVHWAWWDDPDKGIYGVVTTDPIYILNNNGKTIDRVR